MKKIIYAITKLGKEGNIKISGQGYITDTDIICACISQKGKPYIKIFENAIRCCYKVTDEENQYKGAYSEFVNVETEHPNGSKSVREVEVNYFIWFRVLAE